MSAPAAFAAALSSMPSLGAVITDFRPPPLCAAAPRLLIYLPFVEHTSRQIKSFGSMPSSGAYRPNSAMSLRSHACIAIVSGITHYQMI
jgi:hypothetical protein